MTASKIWLVAEPSGFGSLNSGGFSLLGLYLYFWQILLLHTRNSFPLVAQSIYSKPRTRLGPKWPEKTECDNSSCYPDSPLRIAFASMGLCSHRCSSPRCLHPMLGFGIVLWASWRDRSPSNDFSREHNSIKLFFCICATESGRRQCRSQQHQCQQKHSLVIDQWDEPVQHLRGKASELVNI